MIEFFIGVAIGFVLFPTVIFIGILITPVKDLVKMIRDHEEEREKLFKR